MSITRIAASQNTHSREFPIAAKPPPSHDQRIDDCLAHGGNFRQRAPEFGCRNVQYLGLFRYDSARGQGRCALEHRDVTDKIALVGGGENLFGAIARLEGFDFTAQNNR